MIKIIFYRYENVDYELSTFSFTIFYATRYAIMQKLKAPNHIIITTGKRYSFICIVYHASHNKTTNSCFIHKFNFRALQLKDFIELNHLNYQFPIRETIFQLSWILRIPYYYWLRRYLSSTYIDSVNKVWNFN